jgi:hypothetical protein
MSTINPAWLTDTVRILAARCVGSGEKQIWVDGGWQANPDYVAPDQSVRPILADALQDADCDDSDLLDGLRGAWRMGCWHDGPSLIREIAYLPSDAVRKKWADRQQWLAEQAAFEQRRKEAAEKKAAEEKALVENHCRLIGAKLRWLATMKGYWYREFERMLRRPGYVKCEHHDLRGTPPPGHIWIRKATSGKWGKSRMDKHGSPLTPDEVEVYMGQREREMAKC